MADIYYQVSGCSRQFGWQIISKSKRYYLHVLVTGFDIIFLSERMMMLGMHFIDANMPFKDVYIHAYP